MLIQGFHHLAIQVRDLERAGAFYCGVIGLSEQVRHYREDGTLRSIWLEVPGGGFVALEACAAAAAPEEAFREDAPGLHLVALRIDPAARAEIERELERQAVPIVHRTRWTLYVRDPEGNRIGLSHHPLDAP